jgi:hypothetical protein
MSSSSRSSIKSLDAVKTGLLDAYYKPKGVVCCNCKSSAGSRATVLAPWVLSLALFVSLVVSQVSLAMFRQDKIACVVQDWRESEFGKLSLVRNRL